MWPLFSVMQAIISRKLVSGWPLYPSFQGCSKLSSYSRNTCPFQCVSKELWWTSMDSGAHSALERSTYGLRCHGPHLQSFPGANVDICHQHVSAKMSPREACWGPIIAKLDFIMYGGITPSNSIWTVVICSSQFSSNSGSNFYLV